MNNFSTSRSILAALDSSVISRLRQTWMGLSQKYKAHVESSEGWLTIVGIITSTAANYVTQHLLLCRFLGNPSHRASPSNPSRKLLNFNKYTNLLELSKIPYNLKGIPEVQEYLNICFEKSKHHGDLQDLYRRSLLVEPKQAADQPPANDVRQLFNWATRSQSQTTSSS
ncbi:ras guanine nucleotide exchange factor domain-containing protein [Pholiota molesta]|nr:ras guanine nucleotide exchange factor domain-containing protein [Pholiota molesta]